MEVKKELKILSFLARKILDKKKFLKIKGICDFHEKRNLYEHAIKRELELKVMDFRQKIKRLYRMEKEVFFMRVKINLLKYKIYYFFIAPKRERAKKIIKLIKEIEKDIKNV
ncbi:MAG: hypothetical protein PVJ67_03080 [Candidatus Pacearchaeota archaeon]|jgi:hypothetical protein